MKYCLKCNEEIPKTYNREITSVKMRYHYNGLCKECHENIKDDTEKSDYWEYRYYIEITKNNHNLNGFATWEKERYSELEKKFGDLRILYT